MKIVLIISGRLSDEYGGGQVYIRNLLDGFADVNFSVTVLAFDEKSFDCHENYGIHEIFQIGGYQDTWKEKASTLFHELQPDCVHIHGNKEFALNLCQKLAIPCIVTCHHGGIICPAGACLNYHDQICTKEINDKNCLRCVCRNIRGYMLWYQILRCIPYIFRLKIVKWVKRFPFIPFFTPVLTCSASIEVKKTIVRALKNATEIISPCHIMEMALQNNGISKNIKILPHGIPNLPHFPLPAIENGKIKFYFIGRICYVKGLHIMLEAFQRIDLSKYELHIIGGTGNKNEMRYERKLKKKYRTVNTFWHGKISHDRILELLKNYHVMVHPAIFLEVYGLTIAEALSVGRPVLATRCGGAEMQITDGINGWLVSSNHVDELHGKIMNIINHPEQILQYSANCKIPPFREHIDALMTEYKKISKSISYEKNSN